MKNVLIKGGHIKSKILTDLFLNNSEIVFLKIKKLLLEILTEQVVHYLVLLQCFYHVEKPLKKSCELGIKYVNQAIRSNLAYGKGHGPINHLNSIKLSKKFR